MEGFGGGWGGEGRRGDREGGESNRGREEERGGEGKGGRWIDMKKKVYR